jgi:hypothetical protein
MWVNHGSRMHARQNVVAPGDVPTIEATHEATLGAGSLTDRSGANGVARPPQATWSHVTCPRYTNPWHTAQGYDGERDARLDPSGRRGIVPSVRYECAGTGANTDPEMRPQRSILLRRNPASWWADLMVMNGGLVSE